MPAVSNVDFIEGKIPIKCKRITMPVRTTRSIILGIKHPFADDLFSFENMEINFFGRQCF